MATKIIMPQLGESVVEGTVTKWLKKEGESIEEFEALLEVNTDKVDTEIPSPAGGLLLKILVPEGTTVNAGSLLAWVGQPGEVVELTYHWQGGPARQEWMVFTHLTDGSGRSEIVDDQLGNAVMYATLSARRKQ